MKTIAEIIGEDPTADVFTIEEFLDLLAADELEDADSYGYYHDGEQLTEHRVWLNESDIREQGKKYPYIFWHVV